MAAPYHRHDRAEKDGIFKEVHALLTKSEPILVFRHDLIEKIGFEQSSWQKVETSIYLVKSSYEQISYLKTVSAED